METNFDILQGFNSGSVGHLGADHQGLEAQAGVSPLVKQASLGLGHPTGLSGTELEN